MSVTSINQPKVVKTFAIGDLVEIMKGPKIDQQGKIAEIGELGDTSRVEGIGWQLNDDLELIEAATAVIDGTVDGAPATIVLDGKTGAQEEPTLIEVPLEDLVRQMAEQWDRLQEVRAIAKEERERLNAITLQIRNRTKFTPKPEQLAMGDVVAAEAE
jgi:hypothetical protein